MLLAILDAIELPKAESFVLAQLWQVAARGTLPSASAPPQLKTGNAQQCRRRNGLMRHTAASCSPINARVRGRCECNPQLGQSQRKQRWAIAANQLPTTQESRTDASGNFDCALKKVAATMNLRISRTMRSAAVTGAGTSVIRWLSRKLSPSSGMPRIETSHSQVCPDHCSFFAISSRTGCHVCCWP